MDYKELFYSMQKSAGNLADGWLAKSFVSVGLAVAGSIYGSALVAFVFLVFIDLLTRWMAIVRQFRIDAGDIAENVTLCCCVTGIPAAFHAGYINSSAMKHRFAGKIILYGFLTLMAVNVDKLILAAGESQFMLRTVWVYLAATEAMSILENLRDAGAEQAGSLLDFARGRLAVLMERYKNK